MITAFLILAEPEALQYPYAESLRSLARFCDKIIVNFAAGKTPGVRQFEVSSLEKIVQISHQFPSCKFDIVLDESYPEQQSLQYEDIRQRFQQGLDRRETGWFLRFDGDNIFSHAAADAIKKKMRESSDTRHILHIPRVDVVNKRTFHVNSGSRDLYALNVSLLKRDGVSYNISTNKREWCRAQLVGHTKHEVIDDVSMMPINYDATFFTRERLIDFWRKTCVVYQNAGLSSTAGDIVSDEQILTNYKRYILNKRHSLVNADRHPEDIQQRINSMTSDCWGYDNFGGLQ